VLPALPFPRSYGKPLWNTFLGKSGLRALLDWITFQWLAWVPPELCQEGEETCGHLAGVEPLLPLPEGNRPSLEWTHTCELRLGMTSQGPSESHL
jgi:hypothetical protein